ncbi:MAG: HAD-IIA family hydrolase [Thermodesulfobacteriota bacterium]
MKLVDLFDCFLIDLDGVVYIGDSAVPGSAETIQYLLNNDKFVIFLTNNPRHDISQYSQKLNEIGIEETSLNIITSATALASHIKSTFSGLKDKTAYVIGSTALKKEIELTGLNLISGDEAKKADFVIFGGHPEFHYEEIKIATLAIANGAHFFATNRDMVYPTAEGHIPATGAMLASIEVASGKKAISAGKPENLMFEISHTYHDHEKDRIAIIGDHLDTDILGGQNAGISTILIISDPNIEDELKSSDIKPDYIIYNLRDLLKDVSDIEKLQIPST